MSYILCQFLKLEPWMACQALEWCCWVAMRPSGSSLRLPCVHLLEAVEEMGFSFLEEDFTSKTYSYLNYILPIKWFFPPNYFQMLKQMINNEQREIIWPRSLVYHIDFQESGQEAEGFMIMNILKFFYFWDLRSEGKENKLKARIRLSF